MAASIVNTSVDKWLKNIALGGERRATDQLLKLWKSAQDKRIVVNSVSKSNLWKHCFLFVIDDDLNGSIIIDHGNEAAKGLGLTYQGSKPLSHLPRDFARRLHSLGLECRRNHAPAVDTYETGDAETMPVERYRMALVPLVTSKTNNFLPHHEVMNMLGIFTYQ